MSGSLHVTTTSPSDCDQMETETREKFWEKFDKSMPDADSNLVTFASLSDASNPLKWPSSRKSFAVAAICLTTFTVSFSSSIFVAAVPATAIQFGVSTEVMTLGITLYVLGFACGTILWAPLSEAYGRRLPFMVAYFLFVTLHVPVALATSPAGVLICRFLIGACGSATFSIPPAMSVDFLAPLPRSKAIGLYMSCVFIGPVTGPIAGAWIVQNRHLGWTWTVWMVFIISTFSGVFAFFAIPESCAEILLQQQAARLRAETQNWSLHAKRDEKPVDWHVLRTIYLTRPAKMIVQEPILLLMTIYAALCYGILYLVFFAYPYCFQVRRGWSPGNASLPFLAMLLGILLAIFVTASFNNGWWRRRFVARGQKLHPEDRLPMLALSTILLPTGLFWFAWTSSPRIHWAPQVLSGIFIGVGIMLNMLTTTSYLIDVYLVNANSALAANICVRSVTGATFPLFADYMYKRLGSEWATSLLGFLCLAMAPAPWVFWRYGKQIRGYSRYAFHE